ncbi:MAG TPA: hypothetical protein VGG64_12850 [Pirellulales bacterium]
MSESPPTRDRGYQFGLGTMSVVVTVVATFLAYHVNWIRQRHAFLTEEGDRFARIPVEEFALASAFISPQRMPAPGMLWLFSEDGLEYLSVIVEAASRTELTSEDLNRQALATRLFPEAEIGFYFVRNNLEAPAIH